MKQYLFISIRMILALQLALAPQAFANGFGGGAKPYTPQSTPVDIMDLGAQAQRVFGNNFGDVKFNKNAPKMRVSPSTQLTLSPEVVAERASIRGAIAELGRQVTGSFGGTANMRNFVGSSLEFMKNTGRNPLTQTALQKFDRFHQWDKSIEQKVGQALTPSNQFKSWSASVVGFMLFFGGIAAGYYAYMHSDTNPMVFDEFVSQFSIYQNPHLYPALLGFLAVAWPFFKRVGQNSFLKNMFWIAGGFFFGAIANSFLEVAFNDPNVQGCITPIGHYDSLMKKKPFNPAPDACEKMIHTWASSEKMKEIILISIPQFIQGTMAGGIYYGALRLLATSLGKRFTQYTGIATAMRTMATRTTGKAVGFAGIGLSFALFSASFVVADWLLSWESTLKEYQILGTLPFFSIGNVRTGLWQRQHQLLNAWNANLHSEWATPLNANSANHLSFQQSLLNYNELTKDYRKLKMAQSQAAYLAWLKKVEVFRETALSTYEIYGLIIRKLSEMKLNSQISDAAFQYEFENPTLRKVFIDSHLLREIDKTLEEPMSVNFFKQIANSYTVPLFEVIQGQKFRWDMIPTVRDASQYFLASAVCGPEVSPAEKNLMGTVSSYWQQFKHQVFKAPWEVSKAKMIDNQYGEKALFYPPRLIDLSPSSGADLIVCDRGVSQDYLPEPFTGHAMFNQQQLVDLLVNQIKPELLDTDGNGRLNEFKDWWQTHVQPQIAATEESFAQEYKSFYDKLFAKELAVSTYSWCEADARLDELPHLDIDTDMRLAYACDSTTRRRMSNNPVTNLTDELRLYLDIASSLFKQVEKRFPERGPEMLKGADADVRMQNILKQINAVILTLSDSLTTARLNMESDGVHEERIQANALVAQQAFVQFNGSPSDKSGQNAPLRIQLRDEIFPELTDEVTETLASDPQLYKQWYESLSHPRKVAIDLMDLIIAGVNELNEQFKFANFYADAEVFKEGMAAKLSKLARNRPNLVSDRWNKWTQANGGSIPDALYRAGYGPAFEAALNTAFNHSVYWAGAVGGLPVTSPPSLGEAAINTLNPLPALNDPYPPYNGAPVPPPIPRKRAPAPEVPNTTVAPTLDQLPADGQPADEQELIGGEDELEFLGDGGEGDQ